MNIILGVKELASDLSGWISETPINRFDLAGSEGQAIWEPPLIGFADGDDSLFAFFKKDIGGFYWLPSEAFSLKYPDTPFGHLSVMSLAFAHTERTRQDQRESVEEPSARWRYSRKHWPAFMRETADHITGYLTHLGIRSAVPELLPQWGWRQSGKYGHASNWSQRHTAYAAGLGTFGLSDGLITEQGKAVRFLSVIIEADIEPTLRDYDFHQDWCLHFNGCAYSDVQPARLRHQVTIRKHVPRISRALTKSMLRRARAVPGAAYARRAFLAKTGGRYGKGVRIR